MQVVIITKKKSQRTEGLATESGFGRVVEGKRGSSKAEGRVLKTKKQEVVLVCGQEIQPENHLPQSFKGNFFLNISMGQIPISLRHRQILLISRNADTS